jgi:antitoxin VapB
MALNIRDREVDELAAELAQLRGSTKTEAVKQALKHELERAKEKTTLWERIKPIQDQLAGYADTGLVLDKAFYDELSGEDDL